MLFHEGCHMCNDGRHYQIILPLADMDRTSIVRLARKLDVPIELTWSCHAEGDRHCGICYSCSQRIEAFSAIGIADPVFER